MTTTFDHDYRVDVAHRLLVDGWTVDQIARNLGVSKRTTTRVIAEAKTRHGSPKPRVSRTPSPKSSTAGPVKLPDLQGLCAKFPHVEFFPPRRQLAKDAITVCRHCPVRRACAQAALDTHAEGVWGGIYLPPSAHRSGPHHRERLRAVVEGRR